MRFALAAALLFAALAPAQDKPALAPDAAWYAKTVEPFFATYCVKCHTGAKPKGEFATDSKRLPNDFLDPTAKGRWREVVNVLNGHEMPPKGETKPPANDVAAVVDWITDQTVRAELSRRESTVVLRRLNRDEYHNTVRDLLGIDFDVSGFPQDPPAGGFDNNGGALTVSPLHVETYLNAAKQSLDRALVEGEQPKAVKWRFKPKAGAMDATRQRLDEKNNPIVNGNANTQDGGWVVVHHNAWNKNVDARDFRVPVAGEYVIRVSTAARVPDRTEVVKSAEAILAARRDEQTQQNPKGKTYHDEQYERDLEHFKTDRMYAYGPPRVKLVQQLGPQPRTVDEFDAGGTKDKPQVHETRVRFTTESAGVAFEYAYAVPPVPENFWMQAKDEFARPELLINWFEIEGPVYDAWPPKSHTVILFDSPLRKTDERKYAAEVLSKFMRKAYRRPVSDTEVEAKLKHYDAAKKDGATLVEAIKRPLTAVLVSPHFLFLAEPVRDEKKLTDHELAARLSYFLWSSCPDDELNTLADAGKLTDKETRLKQLERMLNDPKAEAFTRNFSGQWLGLREVGNNPPAPDLYPQYDRHLETSFVRESEAFFREVLVKDHPATTLVKSDFVTINERLARFYGLDGVKGDEMRAVKVPDGVHRGGIPTQGSVLTITSNGTRTSPVKRGTWVLKTLLGTDPGLPVANAGEIAPKVPGVDKATVRKRLEVHRTLDQCARCHNKIDPLGFALENYNAAGDWREQEGFGYKGRIEKNDPKIDASSEMPDGTKIVGVEGLQNAILKDEDKFLSCLAGKVLTYALGRELGLADQPTVKAAVEHMKKNGKTLRSLVQFVATCEPFEAK